MTRTLILAAAAAIMLGCARNRGPAAPEPQLGPSSPDLVRGIVLQQFGHIALGVRFVHRDDLTDSVAPGEYRLRPGVWVGMDDARVRLSPHDEVISITTLYPREQSFESIEQELRRQHGSPVSEGALPDGGRTSTWMDAITRLELVRLGTSSGDSLAGRVRSILTDRRLATLYPELAASTAREGPR